MPLLPPTQPAAAKHIENTIDSVARASKAWSKSMAAAKARMPKEMPQAQGALQPAADAAKPAAS